MVSSTPQILFNRFSLQNNKPVKTLNKNESSMPASTKEVGYSSNDLLASYNKALVSFKGNYPPETTFEQIKDLTSNPRQAYSKRNELIGKYGEGWFYDDYSVKFKAFTEKMFNEASSIEELIKFRPDWKPSKLSEKYRSLKPYSDRLTIGMIPEDLGDKNAFKQLIERILNGTSSSNSNKPNNTNSFNPFSGYNNGSSYFSESTYYDQKDTYKENNYYNDNTSSVKADSENIKIKALSPGKTGKRPFLVETNEGKKYIIKIDPEAQGISAKMDACDSVGLQAIIDYYLTANDCKNSAKMYFYDEKLNAAVYEYVENKENAGKAYSSSSHASEVSSKIPDVISLGVSYNDTLGSDNIIKSYDTYKMIDSGHCTYACSLKPMVSEYQRELPNLMQYQF